MINLNWRKRFTVSLLLFLSLYFFFVAYALITGQDVNWDQRNYHYYISVMWLRGELFNHIAPAMLQSWMNPIGLIFTTLPIHFLAPKAAILILCIYPALNGLLIYQITKTILKDQLPAYKLEICGLLATVIACSTPSFMTEVGTTTNDIFVNLFILTAVYTLILSARSEVKQHLFIVISGLSLGCAVGFKLTALTYVAAISFVLPLLFENFKKTVPLLAWFWVSAFAGFLVTGGYWAWILWSHYGNPLFPFYNAIFKSPWSIPENFIIPIFRVKDLTEVVTYPFTTVTAHQTRSELPIRYGQFVLFFVTGCTFILYLFFKNRVRKEKSSQTSHKYSVLLFLAIFSLVAYLIWIYEFGVYRYFMTVEMLFGVMITVMISGIAVSYRNIIVLLTLTGCLCILCLKIPQRGKLPFSGTWYGETLSNAAKDENILYVMNNDEMPYGYIIPFFPSSSRFIRTTGSMPFNNLKKTLFLPEMKDLVKQYKEVRCIYRKGKKQNMSELYQLGLSPPDTLIEYSLIKTKIGEFMGMNLIKR